VQISGFDGELGNWQRVADDAAKHPQVRAAAPFVQAQGMLSFDQTVRGTLIRGVLPDAEDKVADFAKHMRFGRFEDLQPGAFGIVLGADLARALRVGPGEKVTLIAPQGLVTPAAILPRLKQFTVVGSSRWGCSSTTPAWPWFICRTPRRCTAWKTGSPACASRSTTSLPRRGWPAS
jgi:lipoprotein-releasing system permease protein